MPIPFRPLARLLTRTVHPAPQVDQSAAQAFLSELSSGRQEQGVLVTVNHYHAPDFFSWWFVILTSSFFPRHIHWIVTSGWTNSGWLNGFTRWLFPLGARLLGFASMPPMPPDPAETQARFLAVRKVLNYVQRVRQPVIGLTPEGRDIAGGVLGSLPPGVGRFMYLITCSCPNILPVGVWKQDGTIHIKFGSIYSLDVPGSLSAHERDRQVGETVMRRIAQCLPQDLRGLYQ